MTQPLSCTLLVTTYNWPAALHATLSSVRRQRHFPDEVVIADDGSSDETRALLEEVACGFPVCLKHVWQEDRGFRAASSRNRALAASRCEYVVMIDGDMLLHPRFISDHVRMASAGSFLQGGRLQASDRLTRHLLEGGVPRMHPWMDADFKAIHGDARRHAFRNPWLAARKAASRNAGCTVMSCNMSAWRTDLVAANGFDERMEGYGSEDLELDLRLRNAGLRRRRLKYAGLAIHLAHRSRAPVDPEDLSLPNNRILAETAALAAKRCTLGLDRYLAEYAAAPPDLRMQVTAGDAAAPRPAAG